ILDPRSTAILDPRSTAIPVPSSTVIPDPDRGSIDLWLQASPRFAKPKVFAYAHSGYPIESGMTK
ncbi:MAG: hypothetical protein KKG73_08080, partial [Gammaproteobacteria bacterium]|nr:hypothetical protein [Gammaproteobacteria bacterium]